MTEAEWLECADPTPMLGFLGGKASERKLRLFACGCLRRCWEEIADTQSRQWIEATERLADGLTSRMNYEATAAVALNYHSIWSPIVGTFYAQIRPSAPPNVTVGSRVTPSTVVCIIESMHIYNEITAECAGMIAETCVPNAEVVEYNTVLFRIVPMITVTARSGERADQATLLRDIFGSPFRMVSILSSWRTPDVLALAQAADEERVLPRGELEAVRLAVLADALEEAGCTESVILDHLRGPGPHVRGCLALDLLLAKE